MEKLHVRASQLCGAISIPPSKSQTHRALIFGAMAKGASEIRNLLASPDTLRMIEALQSFGAKFEMRENQAVVEGVGGYLDGADDVLNVGNSGIALRFLTALSSLSPKPIVITGDYSIRNMRSMKETIEALSLLKARVISTRGNGYPPLIVNGPITGQETSVEGMDSQHVSALLILGMFLEHPLCIRVANSGEHSWVDLTLSWLDRLETPYRREGYHLYEIQGKREYPGFSYTVPGDFSTALFPLAAAIVTKSNLRLQGLDFSDPQGDKKTISIFQEMGAEIEISERDRTVIVNGGELRGITIDINDCIDSLTVIATLACFAKGKTYITNAKAAKGKECDRISCIAQELNKMGGKAIPLDDGLIIEGCPLKGTSVNAHQDHRMAMSLAVAGLGAKGTTTILGTECIAKTYPNFVADFQSLGADFELQR